MTLAEARNEARAMLAAHDAFCKARGITDPRSEPERHAACEKYARWLVKRQGGLARLTA